MAVLENVMTASATEKDREINELLGTARSIIERMNGTHALLCGTCERIFGAHDEKAEPGTGSVAVQGSLPDLRDALQVVGSYAERIHTIAADLDRL